MKRVFALATTLCCVAATGAFAATETFSNTYSGVATTATNGGSTTVGLNGFDSSLGTLTGVSVYWDSSGDLLGGFLDGTTDSLSVFDGAVTANTVLLSLGTFRMDDNSISDPSASSGFSCNSGTPGGGCAADYSATNYSNSQSSAAGNLSDFISSGSVSFNLAAGATNLGVYDGTPTSYPTTGFSYSGLVKVTYTYAPIAPVPLPASVSFLLAGLAAVGGLKLRRRKPRA